MYIIVLPAIEHDTLVQNAFYRESTYISFGSDHYLFEEFEATVPLA